MSGKGVFAGLFSILYVGVLVIVAVFGVFTAVTGGGAFWNLIVPPNTGYSDMLERTKGVATSIDEEERKRHFVPLFNKVLFVSPFPARKDPSRPAAVTERLEKMLERYNHGDLDGTVVAARRVLEIDPTNVDALLCLVYESAWLRNHKVLVAEFRRKAEGLPPSVEYRIALARLHGELGQPAQALTLLNEAKAMKPDAPCLHLAAGDYWSMFSPTRDLGKALEEYRRDLATSRHPSAFHHLDFWYRVRFRDPEAAAGVWDDYRKDYELKGRNHNQYGAALAAAGRHDEARAQVAAAIAEESANAPATFNDVGVVFHAGQMWDDAIAHYKKGIERYGRVIAGDLGSYMFANYARALFEKGRYAEVIASATTSIKHQEGKEAYYLRGLARLILGDTQEAERDLARCVALEKGRDLDYSNAQYLRWLIKQNPGKKFSAEEVLKVHDWFPPPTRADRLAHSGSAYLNWGVYREAQGKFDEALRLDPGNGPAHAGIVRLHLYRKDVKGARAAADRALGLGVVHSYLYEELGHINHFYEEDLERAEQWYGKALALLPQAEGINNSMARLLERTGRDAEAHDYWNRTGGSAGRRRDVLGPHKREAGGVVALLCAFLAYSHLRRRVRPEPPPGPVRVA